MLGQTFFVCLLIVCVSGQAGFWDDCRVMAPNQKQGDNYAMLEIDQTCKTGTVEWHYPQFDEGGLKITWTQGTKVCILSSSVIDLLSNTADIGSGGVLDLSPLSTHNAPPKLSDTADIVSGGALELSPLSSGNAPSKLCVDRVDGEELSLVFHHDVRTYVQWINYEVL